MSTTHMSPTDMLPPHDLDAERAALGGVLRDPPVLNDVAWLKDADFYTDAHQKLFRAMTDLAARNHPIDIVTVCEWLSRSKFLEDVGGRSYVVDLFAGVPSGSHVVYHAGIIRDAAIIRRLIHAANEILRECYDRSDEAAALVASAEKRILAVADSRVDGREPRSAAEFMPEALADIDNRIAAGGNFTGLPTGYADLDALLGGVENGEIVVVGARSSVGKTAFTVNVLTKIASGGQPVLFFSAEQPTKQIAHRMLSMTSGVPMSRFTRGASLGSEDVTRLIHAASPDSLGSCPFYIDDTPGPTIGHIGHVLRRAIRKYGIAAAAVDYLQILAPDDRRAPKHVQVGDMSTRLKWLARECSIPIFVLSQLSRGVEERGGKPRLSDLRDSGAIEQDADRVIFLHRDPDISNQLDILPIDVVVAKNRNGPVDDLQLAYRKAVLRFESMARGDYS